MPVHMSGPLFGAMSWDWFTTLLFFFITGMGFGISSIRSELYRTKQTLDNTNGTLADIRSLLERMDWDPTRSAPAPSASPSEPPA
jgi:hypothetical protein